MYIKHMKKAIIKISRTDSMLYSFVAQFMYKYRYLAGLCIYTLYIAFYIMLFSFSYLQFILIIRDALYTLKLNVKLLNVK